MTITYARHGNLTTRTRQRSRREEWDHSNGDNSEPIEKSRGTTRYSFAGNLLDYAFNRGGKRQRSNSVSTDIDKEMAAKDTTTGHLADIPESVLAKSIEPIFLQLLELDAEELLSLTRIASGGAILRDGITVQPIHAEISPPPDNNEDDSLVVRYIHLQEVPDQYSMGVFVFPPNAKIPLHDHPGMCVISRLLYGDIHRRSLDLPTKPTIDDIDVGKRRRAYYRTRRILNSAIPYERRGSSSNSDETATSTAPAILNDEVSKIPVESFSAPACTVLYPHHGNLHEFVAGPNGAAVLDVLLPPYDSDHHRDCTFYDVFGLNHCSDSDDKDDDNDNVVQGAVTVHDNADQALTTMNKEGKDSNEYIFHPCWIVPKRRPKDFHCLSGQYRSLGG